MSKHKTVLSELLDVLLNDVHGAKDVKDIQTFIDGKKVNVHHRTYSGKLELSDVEFRLKYAGWTEANNVWVLGDLNDPELIYIACGYFGMMKIEHFNLTGKDTDIFDDIIGLNENFCPRYAGEWMDLRHLPEELCKLNLKTHDSILEIKSPATANHIFAGVFMSASQDIFGSQFTLLPDKTSEESILRELTSSYKSWCVRSNETGVVYCCFGSEGTAWGDRSLISNRLTISAIYKKDDDISDNWNKDEVLNLALLLVKNPSGWVFKNTEDHVFIIPEIPVIEPKIEEVQEKEEPLTFWQRIIKLFKEA